MKHVTPSCSRSVGIMFINIFTELSLSLADIQTSYASLRQICMPRMCLLLESDVFWN